MEKLQAFTATALRISAGFALRLAGWSLFGVLLNLLLLLLCHPLLQAVWQGRQGALGNWLLLFCLLLAPALFIVTGHKQGVAYCLHQLAFRHLDEVFSWLAERRIASQSALSEDSLRMRGISKAQELQQIDLEQLPRLLQRPVRQLLANSSIAQSLSQALAEYQTGDSLRQHALEQSVRQVRQQIDIDALAPGWQLPLLMLAANLTAVGLCAWIASHAA